MSKLYFTKWIPIETELQGKPLDIYTGKVKLFLCSRDIKVDDIIYNTKEKIYDNINNEDSLEFVLEHNKLEKIFFKVIGEISPDALSYVTEGMEFDKEDIDFKMYFGIDYEESWWESVTELQYINENKKVSDGRYRHEKLITIKGACGHFH